GEHGQAYVVDAMGHLIAHPDLSLVLRKIDMSNFAQVQAARDVASGASSESLRIARDIQGRQVLTAHAQIPGLGCMVVVELPTDAASAPLHATILKMGVVFLAALALAALAGMFLARRMVIPIRALNAGAVRIGSGDLDQRISITTGDELETLADQFN